MNKPDITEVLARHRYKSTVICGLFCKHVFRMIDKYLLGIGVNAQRIAVVVERHNPPINIIGGEQGKIWVEPVEENLPGIADPID